MQILCIPYSYRPTLRLDDYKQNGLGANAKALQLVPEV